LFNTIRQCVWQTVVTAKKRLQNAALNIDEQAMSKPPCVPGQVVCGNPQNQGLHSCG